MASPSLFPLSFAAAYENVTPQNLTTFFNTTNTTSSADATSGPQNGSLQKIILGALLGALAIFYVAGYFWARHLAKKDAARKARCRQRINQSLEESLKAQTGNTRSTDRLLSTLTPPQQALNFSLPMNHHGNNESRISSIGTTSRPMTPAEMV